MEVMHQEKIKKVLHLLEEAVDNLSLPKFTDYRFVFVDKSDKNSYKPRINKELYAINRKTGEQTLIGRLNQDFEGYSTDPSSRLNNAYRKVYNYSWSRDGIITIFGHPNAKVSNSYRSDRDADFVGMTHGRSAPTLSGLKAAIESAFLKYNN